MTDVDPISAEIHRKAIENLTNEAAFTLIQTSGSPGVTHGKDFSTCILDENGEQLGLSAYILFHSASSLIGVRAVIEQLKADNESPKPGDGWLLNDPYHGGAQHQGDLGIVTPLFYDGELAGWAFANCHVLDVGGSGVSGVAPGATSVYEEGLRFPVTKAIVQGKLEKSWERFIAAAVRAPDAVINDIRSMIAANATAQSKLIDIIDRFGIEAHRSYNALNKDLTEALLRSRIEKIPDGVYEATDFIEYDGQGFEHLLEVHCKLEVDGSNLRFALTGSAQINAFVNGSIGPAYGNVMTILLTTLSYGDLPFNQGMWRPVSIDLGPPGTVVHAIAPAPVSLGHGESGKSVGKAVKSALNKALACSDDPVLRSRVAGLAGEAGIGCGLFGMTDAGQMTVLAYLDSISGSGGGAQTVADGLDVYGTTSMAGCGLPDVETYEATDPVLFLWRKIAMNSSGPGHVRGGNGLDRAYLLRGAAEVAGASASFSELVPVPGFGGGSFPAAAGHGVIRNSAGIEAFAGRTPVAEAVGGVVEKIGIKVGRLIVRRGDVVRAVTGGGAGLGDPLWRDSGQVSQDVAGGYISVSHARAAYGVVTAADGQLDSAATDNARAEIRRSRLGHDPAQIGRPPEMPGQAIVAEHNGDDTRCLCASCNMELCKGDEDFRSKGTVIRREPLSERNHRLDMRYRARRDGPAIEVVDYYCPACAACLASEVVQLADLTKVA